jgi:hypothetical protein
MAETELKTSTTIEDEEKKDKATVGQTATQTAAQNLLESAKKGEREQHGAFLGGLESLAVLQAEELEDLAGQPAEIERLTDVGVSKTIAATAAEERKLREVEQASRQARQAAGTQILESEEKLHKKEQEAAVTESEIAVAKQQAADIVAKQFETDRLKFEQHIQKALEDNTEWYNDDETAIAVAIRAGVKDLPDTEEFRGIREHWLIRADQIERGGGVTGAKGWTEDVNKDSDFSVKASQTRESAFDYATGNPMFG